MCKKKNLKFALDYCFYQMHKIVAVATYTNWHRRQDDNAMPPVIKVHVLSLHM